jgi:hypothetical protein
MLLALFYHGNRASKTEAQRVEDDATANSNTLIVLLLVAIGLVLVLIESFRLLATVF